MSPAFEVYIKYLPYYEDKEEGKEEYENEFKREQTGEGSGCNGA